MWSDRETAHDCLGFSSYVTLLAEVCLEKNLAPLTLGVFGSWGSGKTSLMRMLKAYIDGTTDATSDEKKVRTLWFNAWRYEGREEAQSALIHSVLAKLAEGKTLGDDVAEQLKKLKDGASILKLAKFIAKSTITLTPDFAGLLDCFRDESEKVAATMERFERDFEALLKRMKVERVVVFIDDLDRCQSEKVVETFETIKLFLNIPECTFVIGADAAKIEQAVATTYRVGDQDRALFARDYLEKIIQIPFKIPEQARVDIECYVGMLLLGRHLDDAGWECLARDRIKLLRRDDRAEHGFTTWALENKHLFGEAYAKAIADIEAVLPHVPILAHGLRGNPRQLKRFLNVLSVRRRLAEANGLAVKPELLIKLAVLEYAWRDFFASLVENYDPASGTSELLAEIATADTGGGDGVSKLVTDALASPGLADFLAAPPALTGKLDLRPYMFLAQTSLGRESTGTLAPLDETARSLAAQIRTPDRIRSRAAARRAATQDPTVAASIVRLLLGDLAATQDEVVLVHTLEALRAICATHGDQLAPAVKALATLNRGKSDGLALAATGLLEAAAKAGLEVPPELSERFAKSKLVEALTKKVENPRRSTR